MPPTTPPAPAAPDTDQVSLQDIQVLRNAMLFSLTRRAWSNRKQASSSRVETNADKGKLNLTKRLLVSPELDAIMDHLNEVYQWCLMRAMPSQALRRGIYFVKRDMVPEFEAHLKASNETLSLTLIPAFVGTYHTCRDLMARPGNEGGLGDLFDINDYPSVETLCESFSTEWSWLAMSVPNELPEEVRERETAKLRSSFLSAQTEITAALREGFSSLLSHAVDRLTPGPDGLPKVFRASMLENFREFFDTFNARNMMNDTELAELVERARVILLDNAPDVLALRTDGNVRAAVLAGFSEVQDLLDPLISDAPVRRITFDE